MEAGAGIERRGDGGVYDLSNRKIWTALDYKVTSKATVYGSATWMDGEQVFTFFNAAAWAPLYANAKASAADPVFIVGVRRRSHRIPCRRANRSL